VNFDDEADAFRNINTADELARRLDAGVREGSSLRALRHEPKALPSRYTEARIRSMSQPKTLREISCADDYDPELDAGRPRARVDPHVPGSGHRNGARPSAGGARSRARADIVSPLDVPGHDSSAMDGYAVRFADLSPEGETTLARDRRVVRRQAERRRGRPGECVRIFTGGVMPEGADTVVMQERASEADGRVRIAARAVSKAGQNRRFAGEDLKAGQLVFHSGQRVHPAELGMIASLGTGEVTVFRRLRVAFFSTGDELKPIGTQLAAGEIYDSNRYTIHGMLQRLSCEILDMGVVPDVPDALERALADAAGAADVVVTSGGVSVGDADYVKSLIDKLGEVLFWKIAMKPGRPLAYGRIGHAHFFGLPGNPVSAMVTFYEFVQDALKILQGPARHRAGPDVQGPALFADPQGPRPHGIPARHPLARRRRRIHGADHRRAGLGNPVVDVARELLHRAAGRHGRLRRRRARRRAVARGVDLK
jgi:molybdopterin molybdotransferase